jgi:hypothetical protein
MITKHTQNVNTVSEPATSAARSAVPKSDQRVAGHEDS